MTAEQRTGHQNTEELRRDIERTREELGDTVEALAAKADIAGRAREKRDEVKAVAVAKATTAKDTVQTQAGRLTERVRQTSPDEARRAVMAAPAQVRRHPAPLIAAATIAVVLVALRASRRGSHRR